MILGLVNSVSGEGTLWWEPAEPGWV